MSCSLSTFKAQQQPAHELGMALWFFPPQSSCVFHRRHHLPDAPWERGISLLYQPVIVQYNASAWVDDMADDASVSPASLKVVAVLIALARVQRLVQERPRELLGAVDLQCTPCAYADVLSTKVAVPNVSIVRSVQYQRQKPAV